MTIETLRSALLWCTVIDYSVLILWYVLMLAPHEWMYRIIARFYLVQKEQFDIMNLKCIITFKIAILMFNLAPWIALTIVGR